MPAQLLFTCGVSLQAAAAAAKKAALEKERARDRAPKATVELSERFYARPADLYECFTDVGRVQAFSQSPAQVMPAWCADTDQTGVSCSLSACMHSAAPGQADCVYCLPTPREIGHADVWHECL